jgi:DNA-binding response OmpR family regulator
MKALVIDCPLTEKFLKQTKTPDLDLTRMLYREVTRIESFNNYQILICGVNTEDEVFDYLARIKKLYPGIHFIIVSNNKSEDFLETCFHEFADDFIKESASLLEFQARLESKIREISKIKAKENNLIWRELRINISNQKAFIKSGIKEFKDILLSPIEYKLLVYLAKTPYRVIERKSLLKDVWGLNPDITTRSVDIHISKLRKKLGPYSNILKTIRGRGYKFLPTAQNINV